MSDMIHPQLTANGELKHLLSLEGLPRGIVTHILDTAASFLEVQGREIKKVPLLRGKSVFNIFFENSTRTRTTFEIAAKRLSADVINLDVSRSSTAKGETLLDTLDNLCAMHADMFVVRHAASGAPFLMAQHLARTGKEHVRVVNAGDGRHAHPTQGLLDMYTIRHYKRDFSQLSVAIVGDILHSRVARSDIHALRTLGVPDIRIVGPKTLLPEDVREDRRRWLMQVQEDISAAKLEAKIDTVIEVLVDAVDEEGTIARSKADAPEIDGLVYIDGHFDAQPGDFLKVKVIDADHHDLYAQLA